MAKKREILKEFEQKEEERAKNPGTDYFRSYYKGYGLKEVDSEDGLKRNEFVYRGIWYIFDGSAKKKLILKILHALIIILAGACLVICGMQSGEVNGSKIFAAPFFCCILMTVIRLFTTIFYAMSPLNMQEYDYNRAVKRFKMFSLIGGLCGIAGIVISLVLMISYKEFTGANVINIICFAGVAASGIVSWILEKKQNYFMEAAE